VPDDRQVVGDEDIGHLHLGLDVFEQVDDLGLDRHIEGRDRLVTHDKLGAQRDRARDTDALALATGELVGVAVVVLGVETDSLHELLDGLAGAAPRLDVLDVKGGRDDRPDRLARVERGVGVLEDHLQVAADADDFGGGTGREIFALENRRRRRSWARAA
jgi:hypothetical protein